MSIKYRGISRDWIPRSKQIPPFAHVNRDRIRRHNQEGRSQEGVSSTTLNDGGRLFVNTRTCLTVLYLPPFCHVLHCIVDLFLQKEWYSLVAPFIFAKKDGGNTIVTKNIRPRICLWRIKESCHWSLACGPWKEWRYILPQDNTLYWKMCKVSRAFSTFTKRIWAVTKSVVLSRNAKQ